MNKKDMKKIGVIGSIASIIGLLLFFFPKEKQNSIEIGSGNSNNNVIQGNENTVNQQTNIFNNGGGIKVKELYPQIIIDYQSASINRIKQDLGEPFSEFDNEGIIGAGYFESECMVYNYNFDNGAISFFVPLVADNTKHATVVMANLNDESLHLDVPGLRDIKLGKSTFREIIELLGKPQNIETNRGSAPGATYTEIEHYLGRAGNYGTVNFGINGFYDEAVKNNYSILFDKKPDYVIAH